MKPFSALSLSITAAFLLSGCSKQEAKTESKPVPIGSNETRNAAYDLYSRMLVTRCTYGARTSDDTASNPEAKCEAAAKKIHPDQELTKQGWLEILSKELSEAQFDSLCANYVNVFSGLPPMPVSAAIKRNSVELVKMLEDESALMSVFLEEVP